MKHIKIFKQFVNEAKAESARGKQFNVKGIRFTYTEQGGRFYGAYLYKVPKTENVSHDAKFSLDKINDFLKSLKINNKVPLRYKTDELDVICNQLKKRGIVCDYDDLMDIS